MRSPQIQWQVSSWDKQEEKVDRRGGGCVTTKAEMGVMELEGLPAATRCRKRQETESSLEPPKGVQLCQHLDCEVLVSRIVSE